jgi:quinolinate synthase
MAMNGLQSIRDVLINADQEILIEEGLRQQAVVSLQRMLNFNKG